MKFELDEQEIYGESKAIYRLRLVNENKTISTVGVNYGGTSDEMCLYWVTDSDNMGKGYGKKTLAEFIKIAKEYGKKCLMVRIANKNTASIALATSCGFKCTGGYGYGAKEYRLNLEV